MIDLLTEVFRRYGDHGADTIKRYFAQVEYTAYWCIRMLHDVENITMVTPETVEDVVLVRPGAIELHQVKTRDESQEPWTMSEVILCKTRVDLYLNLAR